MRGMWVIKPIPTKELAAKTNASRAPVYLPGPFWSAGDAVVALVTAAGTSAAGVGVGFGIVVKSGFGTKALTGKPMRMCVAAQNQQVPRQPNLDSI